MNCIWDARRAMATRNPFWLRAAAPWVGFPCSSRPAAAATTCFSRKKWKALQRIRGTCRGGSLADQSIAVGHFLPGVDAMLVILKRENGTEIIAVNADRVTRIQPTTEGHS